MRRKDKATGGVFAGRFTWSEALDTAADIYHGVSGLRFVLWLQKCLTFEAVRLLVYPD